MSFGQHVMRQLGKICEEAMEKVLVVEAIDHSHSLSNGVHR